MEKKEEEIHVSLMYIYMHVHVHVHEYIATKIWCCTVHTGLVQCTLYIVHSTYMYMYMYMPCFTQLTQY